MDRDDSNAEFAYQRNINSDPDDYKPVADGPMRQLLVSEQDLYRWAAILADIEWPNGFPYPKDTRTQVQMEEDMIEVAKKKIEEEERKRLEKNEKARQRRAAKRAAEQGTAEDVEAGPATKKRRKRKNPPEQATDRDSIEQNTVLPKSAPRTDLEETALQQQQQHQPDHDSTADTAQRTELTNEEDTSVVPEAETADVVSEKTGTTMVNEGDVGEPTPHVVNKSVKKPSQVKPAKKISAVESKKYNVNDPKLPARERALIMEEDFGLILDGDLVKLSIGSAPFPDSNQDTSRVKVAAVEALNKTRFSFAGETWWLEAADMIEKYAGLKPLQAGESTPDLRRLISGIPCAASVPMGVAPDDNEDNNIEGQVAEVIARAKSGKPKDTRNKDTLYYPKVPDHDSAWDKTFDNVSKLSSYIKGNIGSKNQRHQEYPAFFSNRGYLKISSSLAKDFIKKWCEDTKDARDKGTDLPKGVISMSDMTGLMERGEKGWKRFDVDANNLGRNARGQILGSVPKSTVPARDSRTARFIKSNKGDETQSGAQLTEMSQLQAANVVLGRPPDAGGNTKGRLNVMRDANNQRNMELGQHWQLANDAVTQSVKEYNKLRKEHQDTQRELDCLERRIDSERDCWQAQVSGAEETAVYYDKLGQKWRHRAEDLDNLLFKYWLRDHPVEYWQKRAEDPSDDAVQPLRRYTEESIQSNIWPRHREELLPDKSQLEGIHDLMVALVRVDGSYEPPEASEGSSDEDEFDFEVDDAELEHIRGEALAFSGDKIFYATRRGPEQASEKGKKVDEPVEGAPEVHVDNTTTTT